MSFIVKKFADSPEHQPNYGKTLALIAKENCEDWVTWDVIARFNWGTDRPDEVVRAMAETVGIRIDGVFDAYGQLKVAPEAVKFDPDPALPRKIRLPQKMAMTKLAIEKHHELRVKRTCPAVGVAITALDKWFIPEVEQCEIGYSLMGLGENADKARLDIYGSNYTFCTDYADGAGKFDADTTKLETVPLYSEVDTIKNGERDTGTFKWDGEAKPASGMLQHKRTGQAKRYVNVAFSPYTAQMRYWKTDDDAKAQLLLRPFWPAFETVETTVAVTPDYKPGPANATSIEFTYTNAEEADGGWLIVKDATNQVVWRRPLSERELKKGANKKVTWDGTYDKMARNGLMKDKLLNDSGLTATQQSNRGYLFLSWPYTFELKTYVRKYKQGAAAVGEVDPALIRWKILRSDRLQRGLIQVFDKRGNLVWLKALAADKLTKDTDHSLVWDGKYAAGVKNSRQGTVAIEDDMPYRVQIQVHTAENTADGLALAAMHSEVRLYVPEGQHARKDPRRSLTTAPQAMQIKRAKAWPKTQPAAATGNTDAARLYFQWELARHGYHPGPVNGKASDHLKRAVREFKRSVPKDVTAAAGSFTRHSLAPADIDVLNGDMKDALGSAELQPRWVRKIWGERSKITASSDAPYYTDDAKVDEELADPSKEIVLWVDDRHYVTQVADPGDDFHAYTLNGADVHGNVRPALSKLPAGDADPTAADIAAARDWGLRNYRGDMSIGDGAVDSDVTEISSPWVPLKAELRLLSRGDSLRPEAKDEAVAPDDAARRAAMQRAIGPLRVDWSVHDALYDVSPVDTSGLQSLPPKPAHGTIPEVRTRRYLAGALVETSRAHAAHTRPDEALPATYWNCPKTGHVAGKLPANTALYHKEVFADGKDDALKPWFAKHDDAEEVTATVVHDHIAKIGANIPAKGASPQKVGENLFEDEIGTAGIWFNPSIVGGDGYRLRAEVRFADVGDYKFPNNKVLAARYPVTPQAHSAEIRLWRRCVFRGYANWSPNASRWTANTMRRTRLQFNAGHNYYVVDGYENHASAEQTLADVLGAFNNATTQTTQRKLVSWHDGLDWDSDRSHVGLHASYVWPWSQRPDLGRPSLKPYAAANLNAAYSQYVRDFDSYWDRLTAAMLYWVNSGFEARGFMRGHVIVDFDSSPAAVVYRYRCNANVNHNFLGIRRQSDGTPPATACPTCAGATTITAISTLTSNPLGLASIGLSLGSSWMAPNNIDDFAHEMGHHRHLEHASSAGGPEPAQHDSADNPQVPVGATQIEDDTALEHQWDRRCTMSYNDRDIQKGPLAGQQVLLFCGKCAFRLRGWKFSQLVADPHSDIWEPA